MIQTWQRITVRMILGLLICNIVVLTRVSGQSSPYLLPESSHACQHGVHPQPDKGPFSIFVFCDDALGMNIGIILTEPAAGPGVLPISDSNNWRWSLADRFWQDPEWAADVVNVAWSPSLKYVYVATSGVYGNGGVFKLDLEYRQSERILPSSTSPYLAELQQGSVSRIEYLDLDKKLLTVKIYRADVKQTLVATETIPFE